MSLRGSLERFYWWARKLLYPGLRNSQYHYLEVLRPALQEHTRWLDVGCGHQIIPHWMPVDEKKLVRDVQLAVGADYDVPSLKKHLSLSRLVVCSVQQLPFSCESFNLVTANMVMEHVDDPRAALAEVYRVLEPGGQFIIHTPNFRNYLSRISDMLPQWVKQKLINPLEGRTEEDLFPTRYRINTREALARIGQEAGFELAGLQMVNTTPKMVMLGPPMLIELLLLRFLSRPGMEDYRCDIIAVLRKPGVSARAA